MSQVEATPSPGERPVGLKSAVPHGGRMVSRLVDSEKDRRSLARRASRLPSVKLTTRQLCDLEMIAVGAFSPLEGFMGEADYESVLTRMRLANGLAWSLPVTLAVESETASRLAAGDEVCLLGEDDLPVAVLELSEQYRYDKAREARLAYGTEDPAHPGVAGLYAQGDVLLAGLVLAICLPYKKALGGICLLPPETRSVFAQREWRRIVAFQTRNPIHRAHEYLQKCALEIADGLLIHPLVGETKGDDIPSEVRLCCYQALLESYFPRDRVVLSLWPAAMRYAGPREAVLHALVRKNYGCTHFIVGRDHAGAGNYYGAYDAHCIFGQFDPDELGITPLFFDHAFFCRACGAMATTKTCPHDKEQHATLSGTKVREMLARGKAPPAEFTRPEVAQVLLEAAAGRKF